MVDFNKLRANKGKNLQTMQQRLDQNESSFQRDPRLWKPTRDANNKSENVIRFLPIPKVDMEGVESGALKEEILTPMAKVVSHHFQGPKGWYIENSLQTFGEDCPVKDYSMPQWKLAKERNDEALKNKLRNYLPNETYYANVLVIKDGTNPANNGKIMIYEFGATVRKIIEKAGAPEFEGEVAFDPFDPWEGADLRLNLTYEKKKIGSREATVPKFDGVKWAANAPVGDEKEIERLWSESHSIAAFYDRSKFKTFDQLKEKLNKVLGLDAEGKATPASLGASAEDALNQSMGSAPAPQAQSAASSYQAPASQGAGAGTVTSVGQPSQASDMDDFEAMLRGEGS